MECRKASTERSARSGLSAIKVTEIEQRLIGQSAKARKLIQQIKKLSAVHTPVLLVGEGAPAKGPWPRCSTPQAGRPTARSSASTARSVLRRASVTVCSGWTGRRHLVHQALGGTLLLEHLHGLTLPVQKELVQRAAQ